MSPRFLLGAAVAALLFTGCDASDVETADLDAEVTATVASAFALESDGALDEAAHAAIGMGYAELRGPAHGGDGFDRPNGSCESESSFDGTATTVTLTCERESPNGQRARSSERVATFAYLDAAGTAVESPEDAASLTFSILSGSSQATSPRGSREITDITTTYSVVGLDTETVTVDGTSSRSGSYDVTRRDGSTRQADYTVTLVLEDVTGPAGRAAERARFRGRWGAAASGTATGVYRATVTTTDADGATSTEDVERAFTIEFPVEREGRARIRMGGRDHRADMASGGVL
ncbi:hypothetical protein [Rubrivirga sp.]|uniref:hypothetical protein n=1 Tax=Rubrivirga sp. TaxID=1885344 RepID=UPI003C77E795